MEKSRNQQIKGQPPIIMMMISVLRRTAPLHLRRSSLLPSASATAASIIKGGCSPLYQRQPPPLPLSTTADEDDEDFGSGAVAGIPKDHATRRSQPPLFDDLGRPLAERNAQLHRVTTKPHDKAPPYYSPQTTAKRRQDGSLNAGLKEDGTMSGGEKRKKFEEEHHLARALTKFNFDAVQIRKWKQMIKTKKWDVAPYELFPQAPYELDALQEIHNRSYSANVLLEIRDVRVPSSSHHPSFTRLAKHRLLLYPCRYD
jgi:hypothetical protein